MEKILIYIKHHLRFIWNIIDYFNSLVFSMFFGSKLDNAVHDILLKNQQPEFIYRKLISSDALDIFQLLNNQNQGDITYFHPHDFDLKSIVKQLKISSFLMMGVFSNEKLTGYFFLRFFANRKCFVGRLIDKDYRGKGIGECMNTIMYETAWEMGFRCFSTISRNNTAVMKAHAKNRSMIVLKELQNDYLLVEFTKTSGN